MGTRAELQAVLLGFCENVYFQPPPGLVMTYPAITYKRDYEDIKPANNKPYKRKKRYLITVIDSDPDSTIPDMVGALPTCVFDRHYTADNLNHDAYKLFF